MLEKILHPDRVLIGDLINTELLQGIRSKKELDAISEIISLLEYRDLVGRKIAEKAADYCKYLRKKGQTVRKTIDVIIGTYCIENNIALLHNARDFIPMQEHFGLIVI